MCDHCMDTDSAQFPTNEDAVRRRQRPLSPGHVRPRPILAEHARARHTIILTDELRKLEENGSHLAALGVEYDKMKADRDRLASELTAAQMRIGDVHIHGDDAWIDPQCGCRRSPDVARTTPCPDHAGLVADPGIGCWPPYVSPDGIADPEGRWSIGNCGNDSGDGKCCGKYGEACEVRQAAAYRAARVDQAVSEPVSRRWRVVVHMLPDVTAGTSDVISGAWTPGPVNVEAHAEWLTDRLSHGAPWIAVLMDDNIARVVNVHDIDHVDVELAPEDVPF